MGTFNATDRMSDTTAETAKMNTRSISKISLTFHNVSGDIVNVLLQSGNN